MRPRQRRASALRLAVIIGLLLLCIWLLYRVFIAVPPAPPPRVTYGASPRGARGEPTRVRHGPTPAPARV